MTARSALSQVTKGASSFDRMGQPPKEVREEFAARDELERKPHQLTDLVFERVRGGINEAIANYRPSGGVDALSAFASAVRHVIRNNGLTEKEWWDEVYRRGGYRDLTNYNGPAISRCALQLEVIHEAGGSHDAKVAETSLYQVHSAPHREKAA